jgi:hypothetical protein
MCPVKLVSDQHQGLRMSPLQPELSRVKRYRVGDESVR